MRCTNLMLLQLRPGLKCKQCSQRMTIGRDIPGRDNIVLTEDQYVSYGNFEMTITCENCACAHEGKGFIRDGKFKGIHEYKDL